MMNIFNTIRSISFLFLLGMVVPAWSAEPVGEVGFARGVLTGQIEDQPPRILGKGLPLHNGETLNTGTSGFAVIKLDDGSRMTLRPNTTFKIENVNTNDGQENALLRLFRGGFRAITGFISKRRPDAFKVNTTVATIGIRGTEFDARLCDGDECAEENKSLADNSSSDTQQPASTDSKVIGRIALLRGKANALDMKDQSRSLTIGAAVYEQDQLQTGIKSFAVVAFNDKSRVTLSPNSSLRIEQHVYKPEVPDESNAFLRFFRGGMRLVTGLIGQLNRQSYRVGSPNATIGIRGTGFDLVCDGECENNQAGFNPYRHSLVARLMHYFIKPAYAAEQGGLYAQVWEGAIVIQNQGGSMLLEEGETIYIKNALTAPETVPNIPVSLRKLGGAPRPDKVNVPDDLFSGVDSEGVKPGLYVSVRDGDVEVKGADGSIALLGKGEASVTGLDGATVRLKFVPPFQKFDAVPSPDQVTPQMEKAVQFLGAKGVEKKEFECSLQ